MEASRPSDGDYTAVSECENMQPPTQGKENLYKAPSTLTIWAQQFTCSTGVLHEVILLLKSFLLKIPPRERLAVLCFDEMSVKQEVVFDKGLDKEMRPHKNVQVCMIRGLCSLY